MFYSEPEQAPCTQYSVLYAINYTCNIHLCTVLAWIILSKRTYSHSLYYSSTIDLYVLRVIQPGH